MAGASVIPVGAVVGDAEYYHREPGSTGRRSGKGRQATLQAIRLAWVGGRNRGCCWRMASTRRRPVVASGGGNMSRRPSSVFLAAVGLAATMVITGAGGVRAATKTSTFTHTTVQTATTVGEPRAIAVPGTSVVYVVGPDFYTGASTTVWKSSDGGRTFGGPLITGQGGGDSDLAVDPADPSCVYAVDIFKPGAPRVSTLPLSVSTDGGTSFARRLELAPKAQGFDFDRPWLAAPGPGRVVAISRSENGGNPLADVVVWNSNDHGATFSGPRVATQALNIGPLVVGPDGSLYFAYMTQVIPPPSLVDIPPHVDISYAHSPDGVHWDHQLIAPNQTAAILPILGVDQSGNLYAVFSGLVNDTPVVRFTSKAADSDKWRPAATLTDVRLDALGRPRPAVFPWVVAGEAGHVRVTYAIANQPGVNPSADVGGPLTTWDLEVAQTNNGNAPAPNWTHLTAISDFHTGSICTLTQFCLGPQAEGLGNVPTSVDHREGDFFGATLLPSGDVAVPYGHDRPITTPSSRSSVDVELAIQQPS